MTAQSTVRQAEELLRTKGAAGALEHLGRSPDAAEPPVVAMMHRLLWTHRKTLPEELLRERFLDPLWCRCAVCEREWVISPQLMEAEMPVAAAGGVTCTQCDRVVCAPCFKTVGPRCPGDHLYGGIKRPNGRRPREPVAAGERDLFGWEPQPEQPLAKDPVLYLAFGFSGRVPVGIDRSFPKTPAGTAADHLTWAEVLAGAGLTYHAEEQLDLAGDPTAPSDRARLQWLRARALWVRLRNAEERYRRHEVVAARWQRWRAAIMAMLDEAVELAPERGEIWLTAAEFLLDLAKSDRMPRALECAENAHVRLGDTPETRRALGRALLASERPAEAMLFLEGAERRLAELEARCLKEPFDLEAHWQLGWLDQRSLRLDRARRLFERLRDRFPDRGEGYCGLAMLALVDHDGPIEERDPRAYALCQEALARDPNLGATYEVLGLIFDRVRTANTPVTFPVGDPHEHYRRALELDPTRDAALNAVAEYELDSGRVANALELLERAASLDTLDASVYFKLAILYRGTRRFDKEGEAWKRASELAPGIVLTAEYTERILRLCRFEY